MTIRAEVAYKCEKCERVSKIGMEPTVSHGIDPVEILPPGWVLETRHGSGYFKSYCMECAKR